MGFNITWINDDIIVTFNGEVDFKEINKVNDLIIGDPRFDNMKFQIFDFRNIKKLNLSEKEVKIIGVFDNSASNWNNEIKGAIVLADKSLLGLAEKYIEMMKNSNWAIQVFYNLKEAKKWCTG